MGSQATKPPGRYAIDILCGYAASLGLPGRGRVLNGAIQRNAQASRSDIDSLSNRSTRLCGSRSMTSGGMNCARIDCQNGVEGKSRRHHVRQRLSVLAGMLNSSQSSWPEPLPGGERNINTTAKYTRRPANRTDGAVERASHRPQVKLRRREYSSRTAAGQPRGLRG
jgi:hypothetical protein